MSNKQTFIALPGGKECRPVNPYSEKFKNAPSSPYHEFEASAPTYAITEVMPDGEFFGTLDWYHFDGQSWNVQTDEQMALSPIAKEYASFFKQMVSPLKAKEPEYSQEQLKEMAKKFEHFPKDVLDDLCGVDVVENKETVEDAAVKYAKSVGVSPLLTNGVKHGFIEGANWQQSQSIEDKNELPALISLKQDIENEIAIEDQCCQDFHGYQSTPHCKNAQILRTVLPKIDRAITEASKNKPSIEGIVGFVLEAAKYAYDYHANSQFPEMSFEDNCKNNLLQWMQGKSDIIKEYNNGK